MATNYIEIVTDGAVIEIDDGSSIVDVNSNSEITVEYSGDSKDANAIRGRTIETGTPADQEVLTWNNSASEWQYLTVDENVEDTVASLIQNSAGGGLTWTYDDSAGTLTPAYVGDSTLVTTGVVNSGSISSGHGSIDVGSSSVSGGTGTFSSLAITGDATVGDDLSLISDSAVLNFGENSDVSLTHVHDTGLLLNSTRALQFGDSGSFIQQAGDGVLRIDGEATVDIYASSMVAISNDLRLNSDASLLGFGVDNDVTLTHVHDTGLLLNSTMAIQFNDASQYINAPTATVLDINATDEIELNATTIDVNGTLDVSGTATFTQVDITAEGDLRLQDASGGQYVGLDAPSTVSTSYVVTMPGAVGSSGQALRTSDTGGTLEWFTPTTGDIEGITTASNSGLAGGATSGTPSLSLDMNNLTAASVNVANDSIAIIDADASNGTRKESIADLFAAVDGTGLTASSGVLSVDASQTQITAIGTIGTGTWQGSSISTSYTDAKVTSVVAGTAVDVSGTTGDVTVNVDLSELATSTADGDGDYFVVVDASDVSRKLTKGNISLAGFTGTAATATLASTVTVVDSSDTTAFPAFFDSATGSLAIKTDASGLTYNASSGVLSATFSGNITGNVTGNTSGSSGSCTGNSATTTALETSRTIGGTAFDGTANIVPGTITVADTTDTSSYVALFESATGGLGPKTDAAITYNAGTGVLTSTFAGNITGNVTGDTSGSSGSCTGNAATATLASTSVVVDSSDTTAFPAFFDSATGSLAIKTDASGLTYNASTGVLTSTFAGNLTGNVTGNTSGSSGSTTGNAATATALATARTIGGTSFDGTSNIAVGLAAEATALETARTIGGTSFDGTANIAVGLAATATALASARTIGGTSFDGTGNIVPATITVADTTDTSCSVALFESATGDLAPKSDGGLTYNAGTGTLTATAFAGPLTGNVTGNASGSSGSCTGNAATATALATARTIGGVSFDGTGNITPNTFGASTFSSNVSITVADNSAGLQLISTDDDAGAGPLILLDRDTASPADGDAIGRIYSQGRNDADELITYSQIYTKAIDVSDGTEDGELLFDLLVNGTNTTVLDLYGPTTQMNTDTLDLNGNLDVSGTSILTGNVSAGADIIIGATDKLRLDGSASGNTYIAESAADTITFTTEGLDNFVFGGAGNPYVRLQAGNTGVGAIQYYEDDGGSGQVLHFQAGVRGADNKYYISSNAPIHSSYALMADGQDVTIGGALSKASGSFKIDHVLPSMESTHDLYHSFVESSEAMLIYRGTTELENGTATIQMDEQIGLTTGTFELLVRDAQVYTTNETSWDRVRGSIDGSTLTIQCEDSDCSDVISWLVVGERMDKHMMETSWTDDDGRPILEREKPPEVEDAIS